MSDTLPPDIPDPSSATPDDPAPARPRRVVTRPDTMKAPRQLGTVITRPDAGNTPRLPGTYAANYGDDPNWKRGLIVLCTLFGVAATAEFFHAVFIVLSGQRGYPGLGDVARLCVEATVFLLLWVGWGWVRWVLVAVDFLFGAWYVIRTIAPLPTDMMAAHPELRGPQGIAPMPQLALGVIYLVSAGYLAFSADVIGFVRHRREEGRGWVVAPLAVIVAGFVALICCVEPLSAWWFERLRPDAGRFATESLRAISERWDVKEYEQRADADYLKTWAKEYRDPTFGTLAGLGPLQTMPEVKTSEGHSTLSPGSGSFLARYRCDFGRVRCAHGDIVFGFVVSRHTLGPWRLENIEALDQKFDPPPSPAGTPAPAATPLPPVPPAPL